MKGQLNPPVKPGDKIVCYHMDGETGVPAGTFGVVKTVSRDPFETETDGQIIGVDWENGSKLSLLTTTDAWKKVVEKIEGPHVILWAHNRKITYEYTGDQPETQPYCEIPKGSVIIDPWRKLSNVEGLTVVHYGNTRNK
jgi:hypothetical protein